MTLTSQESQRPERRAAGAGGVVSPHLLHVVAGRGSYATMSLNDIILRLGLVAAGLLLFNIGGDLWGQSTLAASLLPGLLLSFAAWGLGSVLFVLALLTTLNTRWAWLVLIACLLTQAAYAYLAWLNDTPLTTGHTDNEMIAEYAAQALWHGQNPYHWNYADITRVYRDRGSQVTPWLDGAGQSRLTYPALSTLMLAALSPFGVGPRVMSVGFHLLTLMLVFIAAPTALRPLALLPLFIKPFPFFSPNGIQDIAWSAALVGMILLWRRPMWRAVLFGLACAFRQQPWFVAPFLLIHLWHESGRSKNQVSRSRKARNLVFGRIVQFAAISLGVFLALNLPFMLWDFRAWALGVFEPLYAQFNVYSQGIAILSQLGLVLLPREFFTLLQASALGLMLFIHWRHPQRIGQAFWIFPGLFFWFYYRGLINYWLYWLPPLLVALSQRAFTPTSDVDSPARWRQTANVVTIGVAANLFVAAAFTWLAPVIEVNLFLPIETVYTHQPIVARFKVQVVNHSADILRPRFAVQGDSGTQPLPWKIEEGPESLAAGMAADYVINARSTGRTFPAGRGGLLVVADAGGDYRLRATLPIPPDPSFIHPDHIANPQFRFWASGTNAPEGWQLRFSEGASGLALPRLFDDGPALNVTAQSESGPVEARVTQTITFPSGLFTVRVRPPDFRNLKRTFQPHDFGSLDAYGLEFTDGAHTLQILFGNAEGREIVDELHVNVHQRTPLNEWSQQTVDLPRLYAELGWELPPFSFRKRGGVIYSARQVELSLLLIDSSNTLSGWFGPIEQGVAYDPVAEALAHPGDYYLALGDDYCRQRNYDLAEGAYRRVRDYDLDVGAIQCVEQ